MAPLPQPHAWNGNPRLNVVLQTGHRKRRSLAVAVPGSRTARAPECRGHPRGSIGTPDAPHVWYVTNCICALDEPPHGHLSVRERLILPQVLHRHCCGNGSTRTPLSMLSATISTGARALSSAVRPSSVPC